MVFVQVKSEFVSGQCISKSKCVGFIVSEDGYVVTSAHLLSVKVCESVQVKLASGKEVHGIVTDTDEVNDLALLKLNVKEKLPYLKVGDSSTLRPGEWMVAFGNHGMLTAGIVSSNHRLNEELALVQTSPVTMWDSKTIENSGGPLVNLDGEVIGVNIIIDCSQGLLCILEQIC